MAIVGLALALGGCTDRPGWSADGTSSGSTATATATESATGAEPTTTTEPPGSSTGEADSTGSSTDEGSTDDGPWCQGDSQEHWLCIPDGGGVAFECDLWAQDCPRGEKCMPWSNDGGLAWNATHCRPIDPMPGAPGEVCTVEGSALSGVDSCGLGSMCWSVDATTLEGECVAMCGGSEDAPQCDEPGRSCAIFNQGAIALCLPECDPLASACAQGEICVPGSGEPRWFCVPGIDPSGAQGEPCEFMNFCGPGSVCANDEVTGSCVALGCCTPTCDLAMPTCPDMAATCVPWYRPGTAPPGLENTGICAVDPVPPEPGWVDPNAWSLLADPGP